MTYSRVQQASNGLTGASLTITLPSAPTAGNLLIAHANSDATITMSGSGWTAGPSGVHGNGAYIWYKIAGASEPSGLTFTPSVSDFVVAGILEYAGAYATGGASFDVSTTTFRSSTLVATAGPVTITPTSWSDLIVAVAAMHKFTANTVDPTGPTWTGGLTNLQSQGCASRTSKAVWTYVGDSLSDTGQATAVNVSCSWLTQTFGDAQLLVIAFRTPVKAITVGAPATTTAVVTRTPSRIAAAAATTAAAIGRSASRRTTANVTTSATTARTPSRTVNAAATAAAAVLRTAQRRLDAAASTSTSAGRTVTRIAAATASTTAAVVRTVSRTVTAEASSTSSTTRTVTRTAAAAAATAAATVREVLRRVDAEVTTSPAASRTVSRTVAAQASAAAQVIRQVARRTDAVATVTAAVTTAIPQPVQELIIRSVRAIERWTAREFRDRWHAREGDDRWDAQEGPGPQ